MGKRPPVAGRLLVALTLSLLAVLAVPALAGASVSHHFAGKLGLGIDPVYPSEPCHVWDLDVDVEENIYVLCGGSTQGNNYASGAVVKKFDKNGNPVEFTAQEPYISGNTLIEDPYPEAVVTEYGKSFQNEGAIAVDTSNGPTAGYIYIITGNHLDVLKPSGEFVGTLSPAGAFGLESVGTDAQGNVYYNSGFKIDKRDPSLAVVGQLYAVASNTEFGVAPAREDMAFDSTGAIWGLGEATSTSGENTLARWEANQFARPEQESTFSLGSHKVAKLSPLVEQPVKGFGEEAALKGTALAVDRSDDDLFVETEGQRKIVEFSRGTTEEPSHQVAAPIGDNSNVGEHGLAVGKNGTIFAASGAEISKFVSGEPLPEVRDRPVALADIGHTEVTVRAEVELSGSLPVNKCEVLYGTSRAYNHSVPCSPDPSGTNFTGNTEVSAVLTGLTIGVKYHFAVAASNADGTGDGIDRTFVPAAVLGVETEPASQITDGTVTFNGSLNPDGRQTYYRFQYGLAGDLATTTGEQTIAGGGETHRSLQIAGLAPGKEYQYRLVARNELGTTVGPIRSFNVAGPPAVSGVRAANVRSQEADLEGQIDTLGYHTTYKFEYGLSTAYGSSVPVAPAEADAGSTAGMTKVAEHLAGLEAGRSYHFRLVATNEWGTTASDDTTFNFLPENCPNEHVRQQMKSSFLPDCRAYELVSPENAEGAQIYPGNEIYVAGHGFPNFAQIGEVREIQNTGLANNPSRFAFYAGLGAIGSLDAPNAMLDQYTSTRTDQGWKTTFSGIQGDEGDGTGRKVCSITLDECLDHFINNPFTPNLTYGYGETPRNGGYLFGLNGEKLGAAPTNFNFEESESEHEGEVVENGLKFVGDIRPSADFSHLAFSSRNAIFAEGGQTASPGSAYDNDLQTGTVKLISKLQNGEPLPAGGEGPHQFITIPPTGVSTDGSHILMETKSPEGGHRLYMSIDDAAAIEVSDGMGVKFIGMTPDGSKVLFLAKQQLVAEDTDESADIYMWQENGGAPTLTLVSKGNGQGNSDACAASWTENCSVQILETEDGDRTGFSGERGSEEMEYEEVTLGGIDSKFASESGGVFFFSPETLAGSALQNGKNLYFANDGQVHYVATLASGQTIDRIQISPDGEHSGFLTRAKLTSYENENFEEMYSYSPSSGKVKCVSCIPDGEPPTADVEASQNGPFMSNDGRLFFATADPLVPADADPYRIPDVYEYVNGRPQLISSGTSSNGKAPGGAGQFTAETLGLESVSSNGQDVFFSTTDTLVPQDANGNFAKIYDARTNGGFEVPEEPAPCVAADECHGEGAAAPAALQVGTGSHTTGGNVPASTPKKPKKSCRSKGKKKCGHKSKKGGHRRKQRGGRSEHAHRGNR